MNRCLDCKYRKTVSGCMEYSKCSLTARASFNPITGPEIKMDYCRDRNYYGDCSDFSPNRWKRFANWLKSLYE